MPMPTAPFNLQDFYNNVKNQDFFKEWVENFRNSTTIYRNCMQQYDKAEQWDQGILDRLFYETESGTASLKLGKFSKEQYLHILANWDKVVKTIRANLLNSSSVTGKEYQNVKDFFIKELGLSGKPAAINRVIMNFIPGKVANVCEHKVLIKLAEFMKMHFQDYPIRSKNNTWYNDANDFIYFCKHKANLQYDDEYEIPTLAWAIIEECQLNK